MAPNADDSKSFALGQLCGFLLLMENLNQFTNHVCSIYFEPLIENKNYTLTPVSGGLQEVTAKMGENFLEFLQRETSPAGELLRENVPARP